MTEQLKEDMKTLMVKDEQILTKRCVTSKYKKLAKERHPDREGGRKEDFQELHNAYKRVTNFIEETEGVNIHEEDL